MLIDYRLQAIDSHTITAASSGNQRLGCCARHRIIACVESLTNQSPKLASLDYSNREPTRAPSPPTPAAPQSSSSEDSARKPFVERCLGDFDTEGLKFQKACTCVGFVMPGLHRAATKLESTALVRV